MRIQETKEQTAVVMAKKLEHILSMKGKAQYSLVGMYQSMIILSCCAASPTSIGFLSKLLSIDERSTYRKISHLRIHGFELTKTANRKLSLTAVPEEFQRLLSNIQDLPITQTA